MKDLFDEIGLPYDKASRARVDRAIRDVLGLTDVHCPEVWAAIKALSPDDAAALPARVAERLRP